jgi:hypothetical protein|tara:strand:- start:1902 stop:2486 length:585 start_codon:yes stop_codon:yes gene_type:complete
MINYILLFIFLIFNDDKISLFNGKDLTGWKIYGTEKWYVKDGELVCESGPDKGYGYLATDQFYDDFILNLKFFQESDGNSGVFFRSSVEGTKISGWQVEVAPPGSHSGGIYESYGRGWLIKPSSIFDDVVVLNQWNNMKIHVKNDVVTTWINGKEMVTITDSIIGKSVGSIVLQIHDGGNIKVRWKDIYLEKID